MSSARSPRGPRRYVTVPRLLAAALAEIDRDRLAAVVGVSVERLEAWTSPSSNVTTMDKANIAIALLALAPPESDLYRAAATLRSRVCAALEYSLGVTRATQEPPTIRFPR